MEKVTLQGIHPPKRTPAELGPPPFELDASIVPAATDVQAAAPALEDVVSTPEPSPAPSSTVEERVEEAQPSGIDDAPTESDPPRAPAPPAEKPAAKKRQLSVAQKAVIAERTDRILKSARPGSAEYADACKERAEAGLVVPALKNTEMSLHAFEQFAQFNAAEAAVAQKRAARKTALGVLVGLGVLATALGVYLLFDRGTPSAPTSAPATAAAPKERPIDQPAEKPAAQPTVEQPTAQATPAPSATPSAAPTVEPPKTPATGKLPSNTPTTKPTTKPTSNWEPSWK